MHLQINPVAGAAGLKHARPLIAAAVCVVVLACVSPVRPGVVAGNSMTPSLRSGQMFLMSEVSPRTQLARGDVVVLAHDGERLVKRIAGVAGEVLWGIDWKEPDGNPDLLLTEDQVEEAKEFLSRHPEVGEVVAVEVPAGHVFVVGDAVSWSWDSRQFGAVPLDEVIGRVILPRHLGDASTAVTPFRSVTRRPN